MAFLEADAKNISSGWPGPQQLSAPSIGVTLAAILENKRRQQEDTQKTLSEAIKNYQSGREGDAFIKAAQAANLLPQGDLGNLGSKGPESAAAMATLIQRRQAEEAQAGLRGAMTDWYKQRPTDPRSSGVPRYNYNGVLLPGSEYLKRKDQDRAAQTVGQLSAQEADAQARATQYEKKYGVDTDAGGLKAPGWGADQATKDQFARDQADYFKAYQDMTKAKTTRQNYEKWYRGTLQPGGTTPGGTADDEDSGTTVAPPPQAGASPPPSVSPNDVRQTQQAPGVTPSPIPYDQTIPSSSPQPSAAPSASPPVTAGSAGGHAPSYGVNPQQVRQMAIAALQKVGQPQTEANIQAAIQQLTGRQ